MESTSHLAKAQLTKLVNCSDKYLLLNALNLLHRFCENIVKNPTESKYRKINCKNEKILNGLFNIAGIEVCLNNIGFKFDTIETAYFFQDNASISDLSDFLAFLVDIKDEVAGTKTKKETEQAKFKEEYAVTKAKHDALKKEEVDRKEKAAIYFEQDRKSFQEKREVEKRKEEFRKEQAEIKKKEEEEKNESENKKIELEYRNPARNKVTQQNQEYQQLNVIKELDSVEQFFEKIKSEKMTIVLFEVPWCAKSQQLKEEICDQSLIDNTSFYSINIDSISEICDIADVDSTPTIKLYCNNKVIATLNYATYADLTELLRKHK